MPPGDTRARYRADAMRAFTADALACFAVPAADAALAAEVLVDADLAGIESHGIAHLPWHPGYVLGLKRGIVNACPQMRILRESPATAAWDGDSGMGVVTGPRAMDDCIARAQATGIGMVTVTNGRHFGAAGYYAHMAARAGLIGMAMCNVPPIAVAAGGRERVFGTNPIAMAAPVAGSHAFLLDIATTAVAGGKLEIALRQGRPIPPGWAIDADGNDTSDPTILSKGGALLPLGSRMETSAHKGFGLGLMVDILSGVLPGMGAGMFTDPTKVEQGFWFAAWRIDAFRDPAAFEEEMRRLVVAVRATKPERGRASVLVAGDPEAAARAERSALGIPLDADTIAQLTALAGETGIPFPAPLA